MKKTVVALMAIATLTMISCSSKGAKETEANAADTTEVATRTPIDLGEAFTPTTNIRYYVMDSITAHYELALTFESTNRRTMSEMESAQRSYESQLRNKEQSISSKVQNNQYTTQASYETDMQDYATLQQRAQQHMASLEQKAQMELARQQQEFLDSIENYLVVYNQDHHYDMILPRTAGCYFNPAMDITDDIVKGLNARYLAAHPSKADAKAEDKK